MLQDTASGSFSSSVTPRDLVLQGESPRLSTGMEQPVAHELGEMVNAIVHSFRRSRFIALRALNLSIPDR